jgi:hypothetical protein
MQVRGLAATGAIRAGQRGAAVSALAVAIVADGFTRSGLDGARDDTAGEYVSRCFALSFHGRKNNILARASLLSEADLAVDQCVHHLRARDLFRRAGGEIGVQDGQVG